MHRPSSWPAGALRIVLAIAVLRFVLLMLGANRYGYFGDELYFLAAADHLDWGYVDFPPLIALVGWVLRHTVGVSLVAIHTVGALVGAATVVLTGMLARELGARTFGIALACTGFMAAGVYWAMHHLFTMNMFEAPLWMGLAYVLLRIINTGDQRWWVWFGVIAGVGMENKYSIAIFGFALMVGLLCTEQRRALAQRWIWIGGAIAALIWLPNFIWQTSHGWPFLQFIHNVHESGRDVALGPVGYFVSQVVMLIPTTFPLWLGGLIWLLVNRKYRLFGIAYLVALLIMIADKGKDYYLSPAYPLLFAAGAVAFENWLRRAKERDPSHGSAKIRFAEAFAILWLAVPSALLLPIGVPILPVETYLRYQEKLPFKLPVTEVAHARAPLPHHYAWDFGWNEMVAATATAWNSLTPEEQARTIIFGQDYGEAGAVDLLGRKYGLPKAYSGHQNYWFWGPPPQNPEIYIILGSDLERESKHFGEVQVVAELNNPYTAVWERGPVLLCRKPKFDLRELWPKLKKWR